MPGKRKFEEQLVALDELRRQDPEAATVPLRKALAHKNNFVVAKAADIVREMRLLALVPELLTAFDRFFDDAVKSDPQCWAKNALGRALAEFEHPDADVFIRGLRHFQNEPVWGGQSDTAGTLRGTCAHALVQCRSLREPELLNLLIELFADKDKSVRVEAARAVEEVDSAAAVMLLRLRAVLGHDEPEVLGACFTGILRIEGKSAIPWLSRFLEAGDDVSAEGALAIAADRSLEAFEALRERFADNLLLDEWFRSVLLSAISLTRQQAALDFLLDLVRTESLHAEAAIEAIVRSYPSDEVGSQLEKLVAGNARLKRVLSAQKAQNKS
jgi:HEAT repeat protein